MSNIQKNNKPNVPNLRFPEFSGEWKKIRVSDLLEFFSTNSLSWDQLEYGGTDIFNLHYGLIHSGLSTQISLKKSILPSVKSEYRPRNYTLCEDGDVAFADASEDTNEVGKVVEFVDCAGKEIVCGLHTIHGRDKLGKTVVGFKGYAFSSPAFHNQIRRIAQGTKIFSINTGNFEEIFIGVPQKEEQDKISHLLSLLDQRIAIQNRLIEQYESLIKAIAFEIIGRNRSNTTLSDCVFCSSSTLKESELINTGIPTYGAAGISGYTAEALCKSDSILITKDGSGVGSKRYVHGEHSFVGTLCSLTPKDGIYLPYVYYALMIMNLDTYKTGQAIPHIYFKDYGKLQLFCPTYSEQRRLSHGLETLDRKVGYEESLLLSINEVKKGLLDQLFI